MDINYIAALAAAFAAFILGFFWYTVIFAKPWQAEIGMKGDAKTSETPNLGKMLAISFVLEFIMGCAFSMFLPSAATWFLGLQAGLLIGIGWVATAFGVNYLFEGKSFKLWLINASYNIVTYTVMGMIIGAF